MPAFVSAASGKSDSHRRQAASATNPPNCPQVDLYAEDIGDDIKLPSQREFAERLSKAVKINTTIGDSWPSPAENPGLWAPLFDPFRKFLAQTFPKIHAANGPVKLEVVNSHGLLYTWQGSDKSLKPLLLMAHQDVVPVSPESLKDWRHPPYEGVIDENQVVWGRGSFDAKALIISTMSAVDALVKAGHKPKRTVLLSYGFDEEAQGRWGATALSAAIEKRYGKNGIAMIVDEGTPTINGGDPNNPLRKPAGFVAVAEKGSMHTSITVKTRGGHSSTPDAHTSITLLARLLTALEDDPYFGPVITGREDDMTFQQLRCINDSPIFPPDLKQSMDALEAALKGDTSGQAKRHAHHRRASHDDDLLDQLFGTTKQLLGNRDRKNGTHSEHEDEEDEDDDEDGDDKSHSKSHTSPKRSEDNEQIKAAQKAVQNTLAKYPQLAIASETTRAVDVIKGGFKINALPEDAQAIIDHRIATLSNIPDVKSAYKRLLPLADSLGLEMTAFGEKLPYGQSSEKPVKKLGTVIVDNLNGDGLNVSPNTPIHGDEAKPWQLFSSVVRRVWSQQAKETSGDPSAEIRVVPAIMQGNTDTRRYWNVTKHIFRFNPGSLQKDPTGLSINTGIHSTNEHYNSDALIGATRFYRALVLALESRTDI